MEDNRTFWELSFTETGLTEAQKRAAALEEGFKKIRDAANAAALNTGNNFVQLLQPMDAAKQRTADLNEALKQTASTFQFAKSGVSAFAAAATVALGAVVVGAGAAGMALSKLDDIAVKAFGERTSTLRAYTTILGDSKQAQIEYAKANELASKTELTSASTLKAQQALIVAGFRGSDLTNALTASMDLTSAKQPEERELTMDRMGRAFSQIYAAGKLRGQELNIQLAEAGVSRREVLEIIGKGDTSKAEKMVSKGQVSAQEGIAAVQQAILNMLGTQKLGEFATAASGSMGGLLSNRSEALDILLKTFDGESTPAVLRFKEALTDQTNALSASSTTGQGLVMMLSDFTSITANVKTMWTDFSTAFLESFVESYNEAREGSGAFIAMTDGVKSLGTTLGKVGSVVGDLADGFEGFMDVVQPIAAYLGQFVEAMGSMLSHLGTAFQKFNEGEFSEASDAINEAFKSFASGFEDIEIDWEAAKDRRDTITSKANRAANEQEATGDIAEKAVKTNWGKKSEGGSGGGGRGGKGLTGFDITDLMGGGTRSGYIGGDVSGNAAPARTIQDNIGDAMKAAGQVSSAPSARGASGASGSDMHGQGSSSPTAVTIEAGAIVVSGVSDPMAAAEEAVRLLSQRIGRLTRAPGAGRSL